MEDIQTGLLGMTTEISKDNGKISNTVAVIPALDPDVRLISYVKDLKASGIEEVVIIDDGSSRKCRDLFDSLEDIAVVLRHDNNKGKGVALKTGLEWIRDNLGNAETVVTLDSDGQHTVQDCLKIVDVTGKKDQLVIGSRDFDLSDIPPKSRIGNRITTLVFKALYGQYLSDTQTGLRAFPSCLVDFMIGIDGDRYEYEMNVLIECARNNIPIISVPIETIYENDNEGTHFRPIEDSFRIYKLIFGRFLKFTGSSLISMLVDQGLFNLFNIVVFSNAALKNARFIFLATAIARVISAGLNFTLNRNLVFGRNNELGRAAIRYVMTCIGIMASSAIGTWFLSIIGSNTTIAKLIVDTALYLLSYKAQEKWVFRKER